MKKILLAGCALGLLGACASAPTEVAEEAVIVEETTKVDVDTSGSVETVIIERSDFELAMDSVDVLVAAKNEQTAIDRLVQLLGKPGLTDEEKQTALLKLGTIRMSDRGYDTWGAIESFEEIVNTYGLMRLMVLLRNSLMSLEEKQHR